MDEGPRFFTVEEANGLVSTLEIEFGRVARIRAELVPLVESLGGADVAAAILAEQEDAAPLGRVEDARRLVALAGEIAAAVERVNDLGCLVKDIEAGLVDFYALDEGEPVFLCWQFGEPGVTHWHAVDEGFSGRKPIDGVTVTPPSMPN